MWLLALKGDNYFFYKHTMIIQYQCLRLRVAVFGLNSTCHMDMFYCVRANSKLGV